MSRRVLVTGASGFVGGHLCSALVPEGWTVRAAVRRPEVAAGLPRGVEPFLIPDVGPKTDWSAALEGIDTVAHLAGRAHVTREESADPLDAYRTVNVEGTRRLLEACAGAGVRRFVFVSSVKAVGEGAATAYTEESPCRPEDAYGVSKLEAERLVSTASARAGGIEAVVVRPPLVYGPGVRANFLRLVRLVQKGLPLPFGSVENARSMVFVGNLAHAISWCLNHPAAAGETFFVADGEALSTRELVLRIGAFLGRPARLVPVPVPLLRLGGQLARRSGEVERLVGSLTVSTSRIRGVLDWDPPYSVDYCSHETLAALGTSPRGWGQRLSTRLGLSPRRWRS